MDIGGETQVKKGDGEQNLTARFESMNLQKAMTSYNPTPYFVH